MIVQNLYNGSKKIIDVSMAKYSASKDLGYKNIMLISTVYFISSCSVHWHRDSKEIDVSVLRVHKLLT